MDKAKQVLSDITSRDGHHKTSVHEDVRQAVTEEHIKPTEHQNVTTAVDRDIHKDHHHTVVQPLEHRETLPEKHSHRVADVEHKTIHHGNDQELRDTLDRDQGKYKDTTRTHETTHTSSTAPVIESERVHHHVHEHIQPVLHKEVIQPHVIHTTVPIHETHHVAPVHHETSVLPTKTLAEFQKGTGTLHGRGETHVATEEGCPQKLGAGELESDKLHGVRSHLPGQHGQHGHHGQAAEQGQLGREGQIGRDGQLGREGVLGREGQTGREGVLGREGQTGQLGREGQTGQTGREGQTGGLGQFREGELGQHSHSRGAVGAPGAGALGSAGVAAAAAKTAHHNSSTTNPTRTGGNNIGSSDYKTLGNRDNTLSSQQTGSSTSTTASKPSLADKLNPFKDADGDGKKGIFS
ncbi:hypothetical protein AK830_g2817 [Neonectria ditissima]|uniref:Allergen n=1 Tax=Neonectria ditissima TaxID=78410 RepID=A0A0P7BE61_9HYPO|nr:hypothetical protein AK830_g2817 [Neonectria ditissima]